MKALYMVYPSTDPVFSNERWAAADEWINGVAWYRDFNEAMAKAKLGRVSFQISFVVQSTIQDIDGFSAAWTIKQTTTLSTETA